MNDTTPEDVQPAANPHAAKQRIPLNVYETTEALVIVAPMPGVAPGGVEVMVSGHELTLRAEVHAPRQREHLVHEWEYGGYERTLLLPEGFGGDLTASLGNGQLAVSVAKSGVGPDRADRVELHPTPGA